MQRVPGSWSRGVAVGVALAAGLCLPAGAWSAEPMPPKPIALNSGWEVRDVGAAAPEPQPPPPEDGGGAPAPGEVPGVPSEPEGTWTPVGVPSVFDPDAAPELYGGAVKQYRLRFVAPRTRDFRWALHFEQVRRRATAYLNGRLLGVNTDPYSPFEKEATGLRPGRVNELLVTVDSRKNPRLAEGWWNWGGITRPVTLVPRGRVRVGDLGLLSEVTCRGPATRCRANLLIDGILSLLPKEPRLRAPAPEPKKGMKPRKGRLLALPQPELNVTLRSPGGRVSESTFPLAGGRGARRRVTLRMPVPEPELWSPELPNLYRAKVQLIYKDKVEQVQRMRIGLRSVSVKSGFLYLNNRRIALRGASIHDDYPNRGAALGPLDMDATVRDLKALGANVTRSHYVQSEAMLRRFDRAGIMVWNQAPVWQRDRGISLLGTAPKRAYAVSQVDRTVKAARNHPSVITHSVANELAFEPDDKPSTRRFLLAAEERARKLDPTLPIAIDIKGGPGYAAQSSYARFDLIGFNQYFGWYPKVADFAGLEPFIAQLRAQYPESALVMTEFGAEGRPDMADSPPDVKGSYGYQTQLVAQTMDVVDRSPFLSGAIHWTLREFEIFPGWRGGAVPGPGRNTRHHKGVLTYTGERKPAWSVLNEHFTRTPLYP